MGTTRRQPRRHRYRHPPASRSPSPPAPASPSPSPPGPHPPAPVSGWIAEGSIGAATLFGDGAIDTAVAGLDAGVGGFVDPRVAVTLRVEGTTHLGAGLYLGNIGPSVQMWLTDRVWVGGGGGLGFALGGETGVGGFGFTARAGYSFSRWGTSPTVSAEIGETFFDGGLSNRVSTASVLVGLQLRPDDPNPGAPRDGVEPPDPGQPRRTFGMGLALAGAGIDVASLVLGARARTLRDRARNGCSQDLSGCQSWAYPDAQSAYRYSIISTTAFVVGTATAAVGTYLWLTAPRRLHGVAIAPSVTPTTAGASLGGIF